MSEYIVKPTKRYDDLAQLVADAAALYGSTDAFRYKRNKEVVSKTYNDVCADSMNFSNALMSKGYIGKHIGVVGATSYEQTMQPVWIWARVRARFLSRFFLFITHTASPATFSLVCVWALQSALTTRL